MKQLKSKTHESKTSPTHGRNQVEDWEFARQTLFLVGSSTPSLSHPCNLHSWDLNFYPANSSSVTFPLNNTCLPACLWFDLAGEELLGFVLLVRRHQQGCRYANYNLCSFWKVWILLEKGGTRIDPGHRAATRWHAGLSLPRLALPGASYSGRAGRSSVELCKTPFLLASIHPARTGFDFHISG